MRGECEEVGMKERKKEKINESKGTRRQKEMRKEKRKK